MIRTLKFALGHQPSHSQAISYHATQSSKQRTHQRKQQLT